ncbi:MAG: hypothetical protein ACR2PM_20415 [Hyphomicrobiales bacterium]
MIRLNPRGAVVAAAVALTLAPFAAASTAQAAPHFKCVKYAHSAVWPHSRNMMAGCGYGGLRWHHGWNLHYQWCRGAPKWQIRKERRVRRKALHWCGAF